MVTIHASSADELCSQLEQIDISVPPRGLGQEKNQLEIYKICHLLAALSQTNFLSFPITVCHDDKPDFYINSKGLEIGVEVTEAAHKLFSKVMAKSNQIGKDTDFPLSGLDFEFSLERNANIEILLNQPIEKSPGWQGDFPEMKWAEFVYEWICIKLKKLAAEDFKKFERNWLSIYTYLPYMAVNIGDALTYLRPKIEHIWSKDPSFDAIFVESRNQIVRITADGSEIIPLNNLWKN